MTELEEVDILFPMFNEVNVDAVIENLVNNSPSVKSITMINAQRKDAGLLSLSV